MIKFLFLMNDKTFVGDARCNRWLYRDGCRKVSKPMQLITDYILVLVKSGQESKSESVTKGCGVTNHLTY